LCIGWADVYLDWLWQQLLLLLLDNEMYRDEWVCMVGGCQAECVALAMQLMAWSPWPYLARGTAVIQPAGCGWPHAWAPGRAGVGLF
jgi:hypothetical protein